MEALSELDSEKGAELLALRSAEEVARLAQEIPSDDAAALIDHLPVELRNVVIDLIRPKPGGGVSELLEYEENTAGRLMNPNVFALGEELTAGEAITALQGARDVEMVFYLYVVDERRHLVGVVSLRRLLLVPPDAAQADHHERRPERAPGHGPGGGRAAGGVLQPPGHPRGRHGKQAGRRHHRGRRH